MEFDVLIFRSRYLLAWTGSDVRAADNETADRSPTTSSATRLVPV